MIEPADIFNLDRSLDPRTPIIDISAQLPLAGRKHRRHNIARIEPFARRISATRAPKGRSISRTTNGNDLRSLLEFSVLERDQRAKEIALDHLDPAKKLAISGRDFGFMTTIIFSSLWAIGLASGDILINTTVAALLVTIGVTYFSMSFIKTNIGS